jgi:3'-phosphoadenosine 5'-phosphosulfate sulfotransferase (PAPS reductase)/FAD synthetase
METTVNFDSNRYAPPVLGFSLKSRLSAAEFGRPAITHLEALESESIHILILREVAAECRNPALLFPGGKDSVVLLCLAEKALRPAKFPFPLVHIDTRPQFSRSDRVSPQKRQSWGNTQQPLTAYRSSR